MAKILEFIRRDKDKDKSQPLYLSHIGKLQGNPKVPDLDDPDLGERMARIKASLEKINHLMAELKKNGDKK